MKTNHYTQEVTIEEEESKDVFIEWTAEVTFEVWKENYGEDADGNRGQMQTMQEICKIENIKRLDESIPDDKVPESVMDKFGKAELDFSKIE
jgi:hypothetical protein